jgi:hypothetical protein
MVKELRNIFHRDKVRLNGFDQFSELRDKAPFRIFPSSASLAAVGRERLTRCTTRKQAVWRAFQQPCNIESVARPKIPFDERSTIVDLVRILARRIHIDACDDVYTATNQPMGQAADAAEEIDACNGSVLALPASSSV